MLSEDFHEPYRFFIGLVVAQQSDRHAAWVFIFNGQLLHQLFFVGAERHRIGPETCLG